MDTKISLTNCSAAAAFFADCLNAALGYPEASATEIMESINLAEMGEESAAAIARKRRSRRLNPLMPGGEKFYSRLGMGKGMSTTFRKTMYRRQPLPLP